MVRRCLDILPLGAKENRVPLPNDVRSIEASSGVRVRAGERALPLSRGMPLLRSVKYAVRPSR